MRTVAVLTVDIRVPHYAQQAYTIEQAFSQRGYEVILCNTGGGRESTVRYLRAVTKKLVDGIILVGSVFNGLAQDPEAMALLQHTPVAMANGRLPLPRVSSVVLDDAGGTGLAVDHLVAQGKHELWYVRDQDTASAKAKEEGFLRACAKYGDQVHANMIRASLSAEGGKQVARELIRSCQPVDGIVCGEDETAIGVVKGLIGAGLRIPRDVAVTGYNCSVYADMCEPKLTSIDNKPEEVALHCVRMLEQMMDGADGGEVELFTPELVRGLTT